MNYNFHVFVIEEQYIVLEAIHTKSVKNRVCYLDCQNSDLKINAPKICTLERCTLKIMFNITLEQFSKTRNYRMKLLNEVSFQQCCAITKHFLLSCHQLCFNATASFPFSFTCYYVGDFLLDSSRLETKKSFACFAPNSFKEQF